jgi:hypothetical protein
LRNIEDVELYEELSCDENKFKQYLCKKYLILSKSDFDKKVIELKNNDLPVIKHDELIDKINTCFWFEDLLNIKRFNVNDIKDVDIENIKKIFLKEHKKFLPIFKNLESDKKTSDKIINKINSIKKINLLQKFIADCYNLICDESIKIKHKNIYIKKVYFLG